MTSRPVHGVQEPSGVLKTAPGEKCDAAAAPSPRLKSSTYA
ncbi:MAG TPA: hypothetical protein VGO28_08005 [Acidimicrobiia bacterium]